MKRDRKKAVAKKGDQREALDAASDCSAEDISDQIADVMENFDVLRAQEYPVKAIILIATQHATHAQNQRQLATERIARSKATANNNWEDRRFVFVLILFLPFPFRFANLNIADC
jgi:hypothetical protein